MKFRNKSYPAFLFPFSIFFSNIQILSSTVYAIHPYYARGEEGVGEEGRGDNFLYMAYM